MSEYGTPFQETEALLAVGSDDTVGAYEVLNDMLPGELDKLARDARELAEMCRSAAYTKRRMEGGQ